MKKLFICLVMATMAVCANAQITWNVRAGAGIQQYILNENGDEYTEIAFVAPTLIAETNIPFSIDNSITFSPSISIAYGVEQDAFSVTLPLHLGYKIHIGQNTLFCPKVGAMIGYLEADGGQFLFGPSIELPFEINRIVVAANANVSLFDYTLFGAYLTVGYKF